MNSMNLSELLANGIFGCCRPMTSWDGWQPAQATGRLDRLTRRTVSHAGLRRNQPGVSILRPHAVAETDTDGDSQYSLVRINRLFAFEI